MEVFNFLPAKVIEFHSRRIQEPNRNARKHPDQEELAVMVSISETLVQLSVALDKSIKNRIERYNSHLSKGGARLQN